MALYTYKWKLRYVGNNAFLRQLTNRVVGMDEDLSFEVDDAVFDNFRVSATQANFEFIDITRTPIVEPEPVP